MEDVVFSHEGSGGPRAVLLIVFLAVAATIGAALLSNQEAGDVDVSLLYQVSERSESTLARLAPTLEQFLVEEQLPQPDQSELSSEPAAETPTGMTEDLPHTGMSSIGLLVSSGLLSALSAQIYDRLKGR